MAQRLPFNDLIKAMTGKDCLNGWDVLVCYDEDKVNDLLRQRASMIQGLLKMDPFSASITVPGFGTIVNTFDLSFDTPTLQFVDKLGQITLSFPLHGTYSTPVGDKVNITTLEDGLQLVILTSLVNVKGYTPDPTQTFTPDPTAQPHSSNYIVMMDPGASTVQNVCIDFTKFDCKINNAKGANTSTDNLALYNGILLADIEEHFLSKAHLQYYLAGISNLTDLSDKSNTRLQPRAFCFTSLPGIEPDEKGEGGQPGALCMWIEVDKGQANGQKSSGSTQVTFHPDTTDLNPLPVGNSACIYFSHNLMANLFFTPGLVRSGFTDVSCTSTLGSSGMSFQARFPSMQVTSSEVYKEYDEGLGIVRKFSGDAINFNINSPFTTITVTPTKTQRSIGNGGSTYAQVGIDWQSDMQALHWKSGKWWGKMPTIDQENAYMDFRLGYCLTGNFAGLYPNKLRVNQMQQRRSTSWLPQDDTWYKQIEFDWLIAKGFDPAGEYMRSLTNVNIPNVPVDLGALDYFLATNLIFPGSHVFVTEDDPKKFALGVPRDTFLPGQIAASLDPNKTSKSDVQQLENMRSDARMALSKTYLSRFSPDMEDMDAIVQPAKRPVGFLSHLLQTKGAPRIMEKNGKQLIQDMMAKPPKPILGKIFQAFTKSANKDELDATILATLKANGYGAVNAEDIFDHFGVTPELFIDTVWRDQDEDAENQKKQTISVAASLMNGLKANGAPRTAPAAVGTRKAPNGVVAQIPGSQDHYYGHFCFHCACGRDYQFPFSHGLIGDDGIDERHRIGQDGHGIQRNGKSSSVDTGAPPVIAKATAGSKVTMNGAPRKHVATKGVKMLGLGDTLQTFDLTRFAGTYVLSTTDKIWNGETKTMVVYPTYGLNFDTEDVRSVTIGPSNELSWATTFNGAFSKVVFTQSGGIITVSGSVAPTPADKISFSGPLKPTPFDPSLYATIYKTKVTPAKDDSKTGLEKALYLSINPDTLRAVLCEDAAEYQEDDANAGDVTVTDTPKQVTWTNTFKNVTYTFTATFSTSLGRVTVPFTGTPTTYRLQRAFAGTYKCTIGKNDHSGDFNGTEDFTLTDEVNYDTIGAWQYGHGYFVAGVVLSLGSLALGWAISKALDRLEKWKKDKKYKYRETKEQKVEMEDMGNKDTDRLKDIEKALDNIQRDTIERTMKEILNRAEERQKQQDAMENSKQEVIDNVQDPNLSRDQIQEKVIDPATTRLLDEMKDQLQANARLMHDMISTMKDMNVLKDVSGVSPEQATAVETEVVNDKVEQIQPKLEEFTQSTAEAAIQERVTKEAQAEAEYKDAEKNMKEDNKTKLDRQTQEMQIELEKVLEDEASTEEEKEQTETALENMREEAKQADKEKSDAEREAREATERVVEEKEKEETKKEDAEKRKKEALETMRT